MKAKLAPADTEAPPRSPPSAAHVTERRLLLRHGLSLGALAALASCAAAGSDPGQAPSLASPPPRRVPMDMGAMTPMTASMLPSHVGEWIYDPDGEVVGSLERLRGNDEALLHVSTYFMPDSRFVIVPVRYLGVVHGKVVLHGVTFRQLEMLPASKP